jgi:glycosyltransferase involved in cell wall biosynthesis
MRKVLFCTYDFPGTGGGGNFNFIKYLPSYGIQPVILTDSHTITEVEREVLRSHLPADLQIYKVKGLPKSPFRVFSKFLRAPKIAKYLDKFFFFPDVQVTMLPHALRLASSLIRREKIDCLLTSSPPESYHLIGLLTAKRTGCPWVAHLRDLWTTKTIVNRPATPAHGRVARVIEQKVYDQADQMIANTEGNLQIYQTDFGVPAEKITYISNGFDATEIKACAESQASGRVLRLGYMGYFDKPGFPWQQLLAVLKAELGKRGAAALELHVAGHVSPDAQRKIADLGLDSAVRLYGV